jgi:hypothetical protein
MCGILSELARFWVPNTLPASDWRTLSTIDTLNIKLGSALIIYYHMKSGMQKSDTPKIHTVSPSGYNEPGNTATDVSSNNNRTPSNINERSNRIVKELRDLSFYAQGLES